MPGEARPVRPLGSEPFRPRIRVRFTALYAATLLVVILETRAFLTSKKNGN